MPEAIAINWVHLVTMQICAHESVSAVEVEVFANLKNPTGIESDWSIVPSTHPILNGCGNPVTCDDHGNRRHWLLFC